MDEHATLQALRVRVRDERRPMLFAVRLLFVSVLVAPSLLLSFRATDFASPLRRRVIAIRLLSAVLARRRRVVRSDE